MSKLQKDNAIYRRINYLHATETSSRSAPCKFGVVLLLEREPRRQTDADLKMANETSPNPCDDGSVTLLFLDCQQLGETTVVTLTLVRHTSSGSKNQWCECAPFYLKNSIRVKTLFVILV